MNERDSKMIYEVKQRILDQLWIEISDSEEYLRLKAVVSETVETFLHPSEKGK